MYSLYSRTVQFKKSLCQTCLRYMSTGRSQRSYSSSYSEFTLREVTTFLDKSMRPFNSPDLCPIEILWVILCERTKQMSNPPSTSPGLEKALKDAWKKISTETLRISLSLCLTESRQSEWPMENSCILV